MLRHARALLSQGYTPVTARLSYDPTTHTKKFAYAPDWQRATHNSALEFCSDEHNAICIVTGASDAIVVDADILKPEEDGKYTDGMQLMQDLIEQHGLPCNTPIQVTGSGGKHYLFSLSKSMQAGLVAVNNRAKIRFDGKRTTIDVRGEGGNILAAPTTYRAGDVTRSYQWQSPLCPASELPAAPDWIIDILNKAPDRQILQTKRKLDSTSLADAFPPYLRRRVETTIDNTIARVYERTGGIDFVVSDKAKQCAICGCVHTSNSFLCRIIVDTCSYVRNYSQSCHMRLIDYKNHSILRRILETPTADDPIVMLLVARMQTTGKQLQVSGTDTNREFYCFSDHHWTKVAEVAVQQELRLLSYEVLDNLCKGLAAGIQHDKRNGHSHEEATMDLKQFKKAQLYVQKAGSVRSITDSARMLLWNGELAPKMDKNPDLLGVKNGVIDLKAGTLRPGRPDDYIATVIDVPYEDCNTTTPQSFINDLFNQDAEACSYMQRMLGYAITGHASEQVWTIWTGSGSNGKSLLIGTLQKLLEPIWVSMPRETLFDSGRRQTEGGPTPHLLPLINKRIGAREEKVCDAVLNEEVIKQATGGSTITARGCFDKQYHNFTATHLPILVCNSTPPVDVDDAAMLRRIVVVPFNNVYTSHDDALRPYNPDNPHHRFKDTQLEGQLKSPEGLQQLLRWLVDGAKAWYDQGLGPQPTLMRDGLSEYINENDKLSDFIRTSCQQGPGLFVNAAEFRAAFIEDSGQKIKADVLKKAMAKRAFHLENSKKCGVRQRVYIGLCLVEQTEHFST